MPDFWEAYRDGDDVFGRFWSMAHSSASGGGRCGRDRDGDGQATAVSRGGGHRAIVDSGDGRHDGTAQPEAVPGCAVAEALEDLAASGGLTAHDGRAGSGSSVSFLYESIKTASPGLERRLIVLFLEAGCAPCRTLGASLAERDMAVPLHPAFELAVVTDDAGAAIYADVKPSHIAVQRDHEISRRLNLRATPFCVIIDPAGACVRQASPTRWLTS